MKTAEEFVLITINNCPSFLGGDGVTSKQFKFGSTELHAAELKKENQRLEAELERVNKISNARAEKLGLAVAVTDSTSELQRLHELISRAKKYLDVVNDNFVSTKQFRELLQDCEKALNPKQE